MVVYSALFAAVASMVLSVNGSCSFTSTAVPPFAKRNGMAGKPLEYWGNGIYAKGFDHTLVARLKIYKSITEFPDAWVRFAGTKK